jgi:two-component system cell cycle response regulator DivK
MMNEDAVTIGEGFVSKCILYIEDNPSDQRLVRKVLATHGYKIVLAGDGLAGIDQARTTQPDLILVDVQMPGLDGLETVRRLRAIETCAATPIVALTAYTEKFQRAEYIDAGFTDYQQKQAGIQPLLKLVRRFLHE